MIFTSDECIILFLTCYFMSWIHTFAKHNCRSVISPLLDGRIRLSIVTSLQLTCDVTRTWGTGIVTSYSSIFLACANWRKSDFHWWIRAVNINFSPPDIHSLACKKHKYEMYPSRTVGATERTGGVGRTDGLKDGQRDGVKPIYPQQIRCADGIIIAMVIEKTKR